MLNTIFETAQVPIFVLMNYKKFISDKEFLALLQFSAVSFEGGKAWETVAERLGYQSVKPLTTLMSKLVDKGLITVERKRVNVDMLYAACWDLMVNPVEIEPKTKPKSLEYAVAAQIKAQGWSKQSVHQLRNGQVKDLLDRGFTEDIICDFYKLYHDLSVKYTLSHNERDWVHTFSSLKVEYKDLVGACEYMGGYLASDKNLKTDKTFWLSNVTITNVNKWVASQA